MLRTMRAAWMRFWLRFQRGFLCADQKAPSMLGFQHIIEERSTVAAHMASYLLLPSSSISVCH